MSAGTAQESVLIVGGDPRGRAAIRALLGGLYSDQQASDESAALRCLQGGCFRCVLIDLDAGPRGETDLPEDLLNAGDRVPVLVFTGQVSQCGGRALRLGAQAVLLWSEVTPLALRCAIESSLARMERARTHLAEREEFRQFTSAAAHDLRAPLRKLTIWLEMLSELERCGAKAAEGEQLMARMRNALREYEGLIDGMLQYARMGALVVTRRPVLLSTALRQAMSALQPAIRERGARIEVDPLPAVRGDGEALSLLFQQLVQNALEYGEETPHIRVAVEERGEEHVLCVRDNGIGIPVEFLEAIFAPFRRLHGRSRYAGIGLGLSICRRIAEAHGGRIWAESAPGLGSVFFVALPRLDPALALSQREGASLAPQAG